MVYNQHNEVDRGGVYDVGMKEVVLNMVKIDPNTSNRDVIRELAFLIGRSGMYHKKIKAKFRLNPIQSRWKLTLISEFDSASGLLT